MSGSQTKKLRRFLKEISKNEASGITDQNLNRPKYNEQDDDGWGNLSGTRTMQPGSLRRVYQLSKKLDKRQKRGEGIV